MTNIRIGQRVRTADGHTGYVWSRSQRTVAGRKIKTYLVRINGAHFPYRAEDLERA